MHNFSKKWLPTIIFLIGFLIINQVLNFAVVPAGKFSRWMMHEMYEMGEKEENIDIVIAGSSQMFRAINPKVLDEELGVNAFNTASAAQCFQGTYYVLEELFKENSPRYVIWNMDQLSFMIDEDPVVYKSLAPYMKSVSTKIAYYLATAKDGEYLDRLFLWRGYKISPDRIKNNVTKKMSTEYREYDYSLVTKIKNDTYEGKGYVSADPEKKVVDINKIGSVKEIVFDTSEWNEKDIRYFEKIAELCKKNNAKLIMINPPYATHARINFVGYEEWNDAVQALAKENGIEYYDFNYIKPEIFTIKPEYFLDYVHLNGLGGEEFSKAMVKFIKLYEAGEDMQQFFYTNDEYYKSIDYITNVTFSIQENEDRLELKMHAYHVEGIVPEYQVALIDKATGEEEILINYTTKRKVKIDKPTEPCTIRVYAREQGTTKDYTCYYEIEQ